MLVQNCNTQKSRNTFIEPHADISGITARTHMFKFSTLLWYLVPLSSKKSKGAGVGKNDWTKLKYTEGVRNTVRSIDMCTYMEDRSPCDVKSIRYFEPKLFNAKIYTRGSRHIKMISMESRIKPKSPNMRLAPSFCVRAVARTGLGPVENGVACY